MSRRCDGCGTRLEGRKRHGFVVNERKLVCGRRQVEKTVRGRDGATLRTVKTPGCQ